MFIRQWRANTGKFQSAKDTCCSRCTGVTITVYSDRNTVDVAITSADKKTTLILSLNITYTAGLFRFRVKLQANSHL